MHVPPSASVHAP